MKDKTSSIRGRQLTDIVLNADGVPDDDFFNYAAAFHYAGKQLFDGLKPFNSFSDIEACPIIFLYRHSFELYMKGILIQAEKQLSRRGSERTLPKNVFKQHTLIPLWTMALDFLKDLNWHWTSTHPMFPTNSEVSSFFQSLDAVDKGSDSFRYPITKSRTPSLPANFSLNIKTFHDRAERIIDPIGATALALWQQNKVAAQPTP